MYFHAIYRVEPGGNYLYVGSFSGEHAFTLCANLNKFSRNGDRYEIL